MNDKQTPEAMLADYRQQIDGLDEQLFNIISDRMTLVREVGRLKASSGKPIADPVREAFIRDRLKARTQNLLAPWHVEELVGIIVRISKDIQEEAASKNG